MLRLFMLFIFSLAAIGCSMPTGTVRVIDLNGRPIEGVSVEPVSLSMNGAPVLTDKDGYAQIPLLLPQNVVWVQVDGLHYDVPNQWPLIVVGNR